MNACNAGAMGKAGLMPSLCRDGSGKTHMNMNISILQARIILAAARGSGGSTSHHLGKKGRRGSRSSPTDKKKQGTKMLRTTGEARRRCVQSCRAQKWRGGINWCQLQKGWEPALYLIACSLSVWTISVLCRMVQQVHLSSVEIFVVEDCKDMREQAPNSAIIRQIDILSESNWNGMVQRSIPDPFILFSRGTVLNSI